MLTVELLERALTLARLAGYKIRHQWLEGCESGACIIKGEKWLLLDPMQSPGEQLEVVLAVLKSDPAVADIAAAANRRAA